VDASRWARRPPESAKAVSRGVYWMDEAGVDDPQVDQDELGVAGAGESDQTGPRLFRGALTKEELQRARGATLSAALERRRVALKAASQRSWVPAVLLDANSEYTWLGSSGTVEHFQTRGDEFGMRRIWPRGPDVGWAAVYCAEAVAGSLAQTWVAELAVELDASVEILTLSSYPECVVTLARDHAMCWHGQLGLGVFEPTWFRAAPTDAAAGALAECGDAERVAVGCVEVRDDRLVITGPDYPTLWLLSGDAQGAAWLGPRERGVVTGLAPSSELNLDVRVFADSSATVSTQLRVHTAEPAPHVVVNEVMANPIGVEPAQEWVELYNDGASVVDLTGWRFGDDEAERDIPAASIQPGAYLLLVNETFSLAAAPEIVPDANVPLLRMPLLGKAGLSNTGETLHLSDEFGIVHSRFPSKPKPTAGASVARRAPWDLDDSLMFGEHEPPGSSPATSNRVKLSPD